MHIELRQHEDKFYSLEVKFNNETNEIDLTEIIQDIVVDKLKSLQARLRLEEKYRDWAVDAGQASSKVLSTAVARYAHMKVRLSNSNELVAKVVEAWRAKKDLGALMLKLVDVTDQNNHFLKNDTTLSEMENLIKKV